MPVFLEPGQQFPIVLACDKDKPKDVQPTFFAKSQSMRGQRRIAAVIESINPEQSIDELFDETLAVLKDVLVGWKNISVEFSTDAIEDVLSYSEARELLFAVMYNMKVDHEEKKS